MKLRNLIPLLGAFFLALSFTSCSETDNEVVEYPNWKSKNDSYFSAKYNAVKQAIQSGDKSWRMYKCYTRNQEKEGNPTDYILVKVLEEGTGSGCPLYTDTVRAHYKGWLLASTSYTDKYDSELGKVFDSSWVGDQLDPSVCVPSKMGVGGLVDGFSTALQHMHIGDRWKVYIPYELGYKAQESKTIPAYSVLVFEIMLAAYYRPGYVVPNWTSNSTILWDE